MKPEILILLIIALITIGGPACSRVDPRHVSITGSTPGEFGRWRTRASDSIRPDEWREFDAMLQELRLRIMADREATGHEAIEASLRSKIHGSTFRDVLVMGHRAKLARLTVEREAVRRVMQGNAWKSVHLKDVAFEHARADQEKRLLSIDADIRAAKRRLTEFGQY